MLDNNQDAGKVEQIMNEHSVAPTEKDMVYYIYQHDQLPDVDHVMDAGDGVVVTLDSGLQIENTNYHDGVTVIR